MSMKLKATGSRGSWFATVDGETLPCVHKFWWKAGTHYNDTDMPDTPKARALCDAIQKTGRVILTDGIPSFDVNGTVTGFQRTGYIAIYAVDALEFDDKGLRFRFLKNLAPLV